MCCSIRSKGGGLEMVAECVGRDVDGQRLVRFLVVSNLPSLGVGRVDSVSVS